MRQGSRPGNKGGMCMRVEERRCSRGAQPRHPHTHPSACQEERQLGSANVLPGCQMHRAHALLGARCTGYTL